MLQHATVSCGEGKCRTVPLMKYAVQEQHVTAVGDLQYLQVSGAAVSVVTYLTQHSCSTFLLLAVAGLADKCSGSCRHSTAAGQQVPDVGKAESVTVG